jgi:predicted phage-related endonuclease
MTPELERKTWDVLQGTGPWLRLREGFDTASEAPAALGVSRYVTRAELLRRKHTGVAEDHSQATLAKFRHGHEAEALARPLAEPIAGGDLYPTTMSVEVAGLRLLASLDGQTLDGTIIWETKLWNEELAAHVRAGTLPEHYTVQMDQELFVSGAERCLFTCTDGTPERFVSCWYEASQDRFDALLDGWMQFRRDLAAYVLPEPAPEPARAEAMESLPAVSVRLDGALSVVGNLPSFAEALKAFVARIPKRPATDADFATTEAACKSLKRAEEALDAAEAGALASITDVEAMRRAVADCRKLARDTRLAAEKMVDRRKLEINEQAVMAARRALDDHVATLNAELAPMRLLPVAADFAGAIKGLRSIASKQDALDTTLAGAKIAVDNQARGIRANWATFKAQAARLEFLFADLGSVVHKAPDDFAALLSSRIATHRAAEAERERKRAAAEQERIAAEAKRMADEAIRQAEAQRLEAERLAAQQAEDARVAALAEQRRQDAAAESARIAAAAAPAAPLVATPEGDRGPNRFYREKPPEPAASRADEPATLKLGDICARLLFIVPGDFLADTLHVKPARTERGIGYYTESQYALICRQLISHVGAMAELYAPEAVS